MAKAQRNTIDLLGVDLATASTMASAAPAVFLGMDGRRGRIAVGQAADLVALNPDLTVWATWIAGANSGPRPD